MITAGLRGPASPSHDSEASYGRGLLAEYSQAPSRVLYKCFTYIPVQVMKASDESVHRRSSFTLSREVLGRPRSTRGSELG